jgi:2-dehydropantoate 2-reductase
MKILVAGATPIGCLFAGLFAKSGEEVRLVDDETAAIEAIGKNGLKFESTGGVQRIPIDAWVELPEEYSADLVFVCDGSRKIGKTIGRIESAVRSKTSVISLQEGVGTLPHLIEAFGIERFFACATNLIATILGPGHLLHTGWGETQIAPAANERMRLAQTLASRLSRVGIKTAATGNLPALVWTRTIIQCGFHALTAIAMVRNGLIIEIQEAEELMRLAVDEAAAVVKASGVNLPDDRLFAQAKKAVASVAEYNSPALQAFFRSEPCGLEDINGAVVRLAEQYGRDAPVNRTLLSLVNLLEKTRREN